MHRMLTHLISSILLTFGTPQNSCENATIKSVVESSDLVAIVSLELIDEGVFPDSIQYLKVHKVYKGRASDSFLIIGTNYVFEENTKYLIFGSELDHLQFSIDETVECGFTRKLEHVNNEVMDYLNVRWVTRCYSQELKDEMQGKAITKELHPFCGCDGKTYGNFGQMIASGITQYIPGECN